MKQKTNPVLRMKFSFLRTLYNWLAALGFNPVQLARATMGLPVVLQDYIQLRKQAGQLNSDWNVRFSQPSLTEKRGVSGVASGHYFHQDLLVAQRVYELAPAKHIDVGSRIDGFVAHVASFRKIEVVDIRVQPSSIRNISFRAGDLMELEDDLVESCDSLSCLHALEHFGLGRYSDPIDINGHQKGAQSLKQMVQQDGRLYLSVPIGQQRIEFNGHRVFSIRTILELMEPEFSLRRFSYVDDEGSLNTIAPDSFGMLDQLSETMSYGCGIFEFQKS